LAGDANAADPVCHLSPRHGAVLALATAESVAGNDRLVYRRP